MPILRRIIAVTTALLLQLSLLAVALPCASSGRHEGTAAAQANAHDQGATHCTAQPDACRTTPHHGACAAISVCGLALAAPPHDVATATTTSGSRLLPEPRELAVGPTFAPELPPPRA